MPKKFLRRTWKRFSKLGKGRKKLQKWRRPTGRDNKMREKVRGVPAVVSLGYKKPRKESGLIKGKTAIIIKNVKDLEKITKGFIGIVGKVGEKKKIEIVKQAKEKKIELYNVKVKKFLKKVEAKKEIKNKLKKGKDAKKVKSRSGSYPGGTRTSSRPKLENKGRKEEKKVETSSENKGAKK